MTNPDSRSKAGNAQPRQAQPLVQAQPVQAQPVQAQPVLLYDGECGLCNACVRFMLRVDRRGTLKFAPLQSEIAQSFLRSRSLPTDDFDSMIFVPNWETRLSASPFFKTDGAIRAVQQLGGMWKWAGVFLLIPRPVRDWFYTRVARIRYRLMGPYRPRPLKREWESRFL